MYTKHLCFMLAGAPGRVSPPYANSILYFETQTSEQQEPSNNWPALAGRPARPGDQSIWIIIKYYYTSKATVEKKQANTTNVLGNTRSGDQPNTGGRLPKLTNHIVVST